MAASRRTCPICGRRVELRQKPLRIENRPDLGLILQDVCRRCHGDLVGHRVFFDGLSDYPVRLLYENVPWQ